MTNDYFKTKKWSHLTSLFSKNRFATTEGNTISIWKGDAPYQSEPLKEIDCQEAIQNLLAVEGKEILAVNCKSSLKLYNTEDYSFITTINYGCPPGSAFFQFDDENIIIGELMVNINKGTSSSIYDDPDKECSHCLKKGAKLGNGLVVMDDSCYISDSSRCECYTNNYVHVINPKTKKVKTAEANWEGLHGWINLNDHTVISIHVDKMIVYNY